MGAYIQLEGNLGQDAEIAETRDGQNYIRFSLRQAHWKKIDDQFVDTGGFWMECAWFTKNAEEALKILRKGVSVQVLGDLRQGHWKDSRSGEERSRFSVSARRVTLQLRGIESVAYRQAGSGPQDSTSTQLQQSTHDLDIDQ